MAKRKRGAKRRKAKAPSSAARSSALAGVLCPNCAEAVSQLDAYCPACGTLILSGEEE